MNQSNFDSNNCNCSCVEVKNYSRMPAEKPFEGYPARESNHRERSRTKCYSKKRKETLSYPPIPHGYCLVPCPEPEYKPKLKLSFEKQDPPNLYKPLERPQPYDSSTNDDLSTYEERRVLSGQYPCFCMQPYGHNAQNSAAYFPICNQCRRSRHKRKSQCSSKRAWNFLKLRTKRIFGKSIHRKRKASQCGYLHCRCGCPCVPPNLQRYSNYWTPCDLNMQCKKIGTRENQTSQATPRTDFEVEPLYHSNCFSKKRSKKASFHTPQDYHECHNERWGHPTPNDSNNDGKTYSKCCCECDVDYCECRCCCVGQCKNVDVAQKTQTSMQNIKECFTQTDFPKKCCRCCKCCAQKSTCYSRHNHPPPSNGPPHSGQCPGCTNCLYIDGPCLPPPNFQCVGHKPNDVTIESEKQYSPNEKTVRKTQMVRSNSVQCTAACVNQETSCDDQFTTKRIDELMRGLFDEKSENIDEKCGGFGGDVPVYKTAFAWTHNFLKNFSSPKNKTNKFVTDDGVFSSPLTGRNYNLYLQGVDSPRVPNESNLPKPFELNHEIFSNNASKTVYKSYGEHNKLISSICDAILTKRDNDEDLPIGNSQYVCKSDLTSTPPSQLLKVDGTTRPETIIEEVLPKEEKQNLIKKLLPKSKISKLKKPSSKQSSIADDTSNTSAIPTVSPSSRAQSSANKPPKGKVQTKGTSKQNAQSERKVPKQKVALKSEPSNSEALCHQIPELPGNLNCKSSVKPKQQCRNRNQKGNTSPIDYDRLKHLDFSSVRFSKPDPMTATASDFFSQKNMSQKDFILKNLPSFNSSISHEYQIKSLLDSKCSSSIELIENTSSPLIPLTPNGSRNSMSPRNKIQCDSNGKLKVNKIERSDPEETINILLAGIERRGKGKSNSKRSLWS